MQKFERLRRMRKLAVYLSGLFLTFHYVLILYVNSSLLKEFLDPKAVGILYVIGSILSIILFVNIPKILRLIGNFWVSMLFIAIELLATLGIASSSRPSLLIIFFLLHHSVISLIFYSLDIFLEHEQGRESDTGLNRGVFLSFQNIAWVVAPFLAGFIAKNYGLPHNYLFSSIFILPLIVNLVLAFKNYDDRYIAKTRLKDNWRLLKSRLDIKRIVAANTLLQFFYAIMVIYLPILLHEEIGFDWSQIGAILSIMLLPFLLLEFPLGYIADKKIGEVEILKGGFVVIAVSTIIISLMREPNFLLWAAVMFASRVGASSVEIASESYFFKKVKGEDAGLISVFRMIRPLSYIAASLFAVFILVFTSYHGLFAALGAVALAGLFFIPKRDTK